MSDLASTTEAEIWSRAIRPDIGDLSREAARELLRFRLSDRDVERVDELSARAQAGTISSEELLELDHYLNVGRALEFIKAKARISLHDAAA